MVSAYAFAALTFSRSTQTAVSAVVTTVLAHHMVTPKATRLTQSKVATPPNNNFQTFVMAIAVNHNALASVTLLSQPHGNPLPLYRPPSNLATSMRGERRHLGRRRRGREDEAGGRSQGNCGGTRQGH